MPSKKACMKIKDPAARKRCLGYTGEFAASEDEKVKATSKKASKKIKTGRY